MEIISLSDKVYKREEIKHKAIQHDGPYQNLRLTFGKIFWEIFGKIN